MSKVVLFFTGVTVLGFATYLYLDSTKQAVTTDQQLRRIANNNANSILNKVDYRIGNNGAKILNSFIDNFDFNNLFDNSNKGGVNAENEDSNLDNSYYDDQETDYENQENEDDFNF